MPSTSNSTSSSFTTPSTPHPQNLLQLLSQTASKPSGTRKGIAVYQSLTQLNKDPQSVTYRRLFTEAQARSTKITKLLQRAGNGNRIILLHLTQHLPNIMGFWAVIAAGAVPCFLPPLPDDVEARRELLRHLRALLHNPVIITSNALAYKFDIDGLDDMNVKTVEDIGEAPTTAQESNICPGFDKKKGDVAVLILTSVSAKAVQLSHGQILNCLKRRSAMHWTTDEDIFFNCIDFTHVDALAEIHLHAMWLGADQVYVPDMTNRPESFLDIVAKERVSYTVVSKNFVRVLVNDLASEALARRADRRLSNTLEIEDDVVSEGSLDDDWDLSSLTALVFGGELEGNSGRLSRDICEGLDGWLRRYGAQESFVRPGFGMAETFGHVFYNVVDCPWYDIERCDEFVNLGQAIPVLRWRIALPDDTECNGITPGELQVMGPLVFEEYYNDLRATYGCRNVMGWFKTGEMVYQDEDDRLHLVEKPGEGELININGIMQQCDIIQAAAEVAGLMPKHTVAFPHRPKGYKNDVLVVACLPTQARPNGATRLDTALRMTRAIVSNCGERPFKIIPLTPRLLEKGPDGKLDRVAMMKSFEAGKFDEAIRADDEAITAFKTRQAARIAGSPTNTESAILKVCRDLLGNLGDTTVEGDILKLGMSSMDLMKFRAGLEAKLGLARIPLPTFFANPVIRNLGQALDAISRTTSTASARANNYDPIVTLQSSGTKTPIFLVHPNTGDTLGFLNISRRFVNRSVYALRARGFDGEPFFTSIGEMVSTYHRAMKRVQPQGPYAIVGYSFGAILAFELAKVIEKQGDEVKFLATLDQPPYTELRVKNCDWHEVALTLATLLDFVKERYAHDKLRDLRDLSKDQLVTHIFKLAPVARLQDLGMSQEKFRSWADLEYGLNLLEKEYVPEGKISKMDVFYAGPPVVVAETRAEWYNDYISLWADFVDEGGCEFKSILGCTHQNMISPPKLAGFWEVFKRVMQARGL